MKLATDEASVIGAQDRDVASTGSRETSDTSAEGLPFDTIGAHTLFVSDLHLGSPEASMESLLFLLARVQARHLVLLGDVIDIRAVLRRGIGGRASYEPTRAFLASLERFDSVHYVVGNHDKLLELFDGLVFRNIRVVRELSLNGPGRPTLVLHGHQADSATRQQHTPEWKADLACWIYYTSHRLDRLIHRCLPERFERGTFVRAIKRQSRSWQAYRRRYVGHVCELARQRGFSRIVCGHIHWPETLFADSGVLYANCGDWVEHYTALVLDNSDRFWHVAYEERALIVATPPEMSR